MPELHKIKDQLSKQATVGKIMTKLKLIWHGVAKDEQGNPIRQPEHFLRVKILCQSLQAATKKGDWYLDHWIVLSDQNEVVCFISLHRDFKQLDAEVLQHEVFPRILDKIQDKFILDYPDGLWLHIMGIHPLQSFAFELEYKDFK